jgi:predicted nucleic acid-binding protein
MLVTLAASPPAGQTSASKPQSRWPRIGQIAAVAIRSGASLLHADVDFDVIARHTPLRLEPAK